MLVSLRMGGAAGKFLSEEEYEEAETYRDKNVVELRLVYQKRQHDKERQERRKVHAAVISAVAVAFAMLSVVAIRGCKAEGKARKQAQQAEADATKGWVAEGEAKNRALKAEAEAARARKLADLHVADLYYEKSSQREADDWDASGAFLWYAAAWSKFKESSDVLDLKSEDRERLKTSHLVQLATAREQLPFLSGMAYHKQLIASARTPDGNFLLTVGADTDGGTSSPGVLFWRWLDRRGNAEWEPSRLPWGQAPPRQAFAQAMAYVSPNGRFAVVSGGPKDAASAIYVWNIPEAGPGQFVRELKGFQGNVTAAGFSPDGQLFAVVSQLRDKSKVRCWRSGNWDTSTELVVPEEIGLLGQLAFSPLPSGNRLAVAVTSVSSASTVDQAAIIPGGNDRLICVEWSLNESRGDALLRRYTWRGWFPLASMPGEIQTFVAYKPDGRELLISNSFQNGPWAYVWLFDSSRKGPTTESVTAPWSQLLTPLPAGPVLHAAYSPWDDRLVIACGNGKAELWGVDPSGQGHKQYRTIRAFEHKTQIFKADFSTDGQYVVTASRDYRALIWHADSGQLAHPSFYHSGSVTDAGFTLDGHSLITSSWDTIQRWDLTRGESRPLPVGTMRGVRTTAADPEENLIVTAGEHERRAEQLGSAGWARLWDTVTGDPRSPELHHPAPVIHAALSGSDRDLASTVTSDGEVRLWKASSGRELWVEKPKVGTAVYTAFGRAKGQDYLLALIHSDPLSLASASSLRIDPMSRTESGRPLRLSLASASSLRIDPLDSRGERTDGARTFSYQAPFTAAAFSPECKHVIAYTSGGVNSPGKAVVWDVQSGKQIVLKGSGRSGSADDEPITHAAFTSDGDYLVTTGRDDKAFVWDLSDGTYKELLTNKDEEIGHTADIVFASFNRAGSRVVTAGADGWAIIWEWSPDQHRFRMIQRLKNDRALTHAVFSPHERYVLTADTDGTTRLFDIEDRRPLVTRSHPGQSILQIVFREDKDRHARVFLIGNQARRGPAFSNRQGQGPNYRVANPSGGLVCPVVTEWRLTREAPSEEHYGPLAQWTASRKLDETRFRTELTSLTQDVIFRLWKDTASRGALTGPLSSDEVSQWHEREAAQCELDERWMPAIDHLTSALMNTSVNRRLMLLARRARAYSELKNWESAELDLNRALIKISEDSELWQARANARIQLGHEKNERTKLEGAISDYRQAVRVNPDNGRARAQLADAFVLSGQFKEALAEYDQAVERDRKNPDLLLKRAQAFMKSGDRPFNRAYADFLTAGRLFRDRQRLDDADKAYSGAIGLLKEGVEGSRPLQAKVHAEFAEVEEHRAYMKPESERHALFQFAGKHYLEATNLDDTAWTCWSGLARCHERLEEWKEASQAFEKALKLNPGDHTLSVSLAGSLVKIKDWDQASMAYSKMIQRQPKDPLLRLRLAAIYLQPISPEKEASSERLEAARLCLAEAVKDEALSKQSALWSHLAVIEVAAKKFDDYQATRTRMFVLFKSSVTNDENNLAWVVALVKGTTEDAENVLKLAEKAVSVFPHNFNYLNTYGAVLYRAGRREKAITTLEEATKQRARAFNLSPEQRAYGDALDKLFIAMAQYTPEQPEPARQTLRLAVRTIDRIKPAQQSEAPEQSLDQFWARFRIRDPAA